MRQYLRKPGATQMNLLRKLTRTRHESHKLIAKVKKELQLS